MASGGFDPLSGEAPRRKTCPATQPTPNATKLKTATHMILRNIAENAAGAYGNEPDSPITRRVSDCTIWRKWTRRSVTKPPAILMQAAAQMELYVLCVTSLIPYSVFRASGLCCNLLEDSFPSRFLLHIRLDAEHSTF